MAHFSNSFIRLVAFGILLASAFISVRCSSSDSTVPIYGCTDPEAANYSLVADADDESCIYSGCTSPLADNYDDRAELDDGSCIYSGCIDPAANNFNPQADVDDGSCIYSGCTDPDALNFAARAEIDDGSCVYSGCTNSEAENYDERASVDDGSCVFRGCTDVDANNYNPIATIDDGSCQYSIHPPGFTYLAENEEGYPEFVHDQTSMVFVQLPGGTFTMGATVPYDTLGVPGQEMPGVDEFPAHEVTLSPFMIAKYECTQREWETVMGSNPSRFVGINRPVHQVSWNDIQVFESLSGLSLPTEAQWEYAVRAGTRTRFFFGDDPGPVNAGWPIAQLYTVFSPNAPPAGPAEVGTLRPNQFGLFDMYGNVYEWCEDYENEDFFSSPEATELDPVNDEFHTRRIIRGASYRNTNPDGAFRSARRPEAPQTNRNVDYGFRAVFNFPK